MKENFTFTLELVKDAEPGTGLGGEIVNDLVPRDNDGNPVIQASHLKGLMRAALREIAEPFAESWKPIIDQHFSPGSKEWPDVLIELVFGTFDQQDHRIESCFRITDAKIEFDQCNWYSSQPHGSSNSDEESVGRPIAPTRYVSRTAVEAIGIALDKSLRTTEVVPRGTVFTGNVFSKVAEGSVEDLAWKLALLSVEAVGGSRNRGGHCVLTITAPERQAVWSNPGELLIALDAAIRERRFHSRSSVTGSKFEGVTTSSEKAATTLVDLVFIARSPVCCPERADKSNVIQTGFVIPASAVQGIILNHINEQNADLATALFDSENFRCWPMSPCLHPGDPQFESVIESVKNGEGLDDLPNALRVSLSHRAAKYAVDNWYTSDHFEDFAFGPRTEKRAWKEAPDGAPLKSADGVLIFGPSVQPGPKLWKASDMPHHVTTHGVLDGPPNPDKSPNDRRNLFSVDAMAPLIWRGLVSLPSDVAESVVESLNLASEFSIGKGRTVRGAGQLIARIVEQFPAIDSSLNQQETMALVLQSPALVPDEIGDDVPAEEILRQIATRWLKHHGLPPLAPPPNCWASIGVRFGWNRHRSDAQGRPSPFQEAARVILPGSVFILPITTERGKLQQAILDGFRADPSKPDDGRNRGFGAIALHPGKAVELYRGRRTIRVVPTSPLKAAFDIVMRLETSPGLPSPSQIRAVEQRIDSNDPMSLQRARNYLNEQTRRNPHAWFAWQQVIEDIDEILKSFEPEVAKRALKLFADVAVVKRET